MDYLDPTSINGLNLYAYCNNDPVNYYDPEGYLAIEITAGTIFIVVLGVFILSVFSLFLSQKRQGNPVSNLNYWILKAWNDLKDKATDIWNDIAEWWIKLFERSIILPTQNFSFNFVPIIDYNLFASAEDPYARPGQKKQGCELKNKARARFTTKSRYRGCRKPPKHHTLGRGHRKYLWWLLWRIYNREKDELWWDMD